MTKHVREGTPLLFTPLEMQPENKLFLLTLPPPPPPPSQLITFPYPIPH